MDFEAYLGSNYQLPVQVTGEIMHPCSDILSHDDYASHMDSSIEKLLYPTAAASRSTQFISNAMNHENLIKEYFESSMETNALVTNFHSATRVQDGSYRSNSNVNLPSSSLATDDLNFTNSMYLDNLVAQQQLSRAVQCQSEQQKRQHKQFSANQYAGHLMNSDESAQMQKKPRLESMKDDILLQHMIQQILLSEKSRQLMSYDKKVTPPSQYQVLNAPQRETTPSIPRSIDACYQQNVTRQPMTNCQKQVPERQVSQIPAINGAACSARLAQYLHHQRSRPKHNDIAYWREFVAEYFAVGAKKRWCFSNHDRIGHASFSQAVQDSWSCDICGNKSGRGFEVTFEVLPRLSKVNSEGRLVDMMFYLDSPRESKLPLGQMMLQYTKAVQETVYQNSRVLHEGQLRVIFTKELKIMSLEFCANRHEEFIPRRLIAPKVNQLIQAAQKFQNNIELNKSDGGLGPCLQASHDRFVTARDQVAKTLDSQIANEYGFPKQLVRFFQTAEVVNSMKDLMAYSHDNNLGPIESLKRYAQETKMKQMQMYQRTLYQDPQALPSTGNNQYPIAESRVLNEPWRSTAEKNFHQRLLMGNVNSNRVTSVNHSSSSTSRMMMTTANVPTNSSRGAAGSRRKGPCKCGLVIGPKSSSDRAQSSSMLKGPIKTEADMLEEHDIRVKEEPFYDY